MKPIRVLIADSDDSLLAWCREYLSRHGLEVATATSGLDCVEQLRSFTPDALVLEPELLWGGADGVLAMMDEDPRVPRVPVLILFAWQVYAWQDRRTLDGLPTSFIGKQMAKPLALRLLVKEVTGLLDGTPPRAWIEKRGGSANDEANTNNEAKDALEGTLRGNR